MGPLTLNQPLRMNIPVNCSYTRHYDDNNAAQLGCVEHNLFIHLPNSNGTQEAIGMQRPSAFKMLMYIFMLVLFVMVLLSGVVMFDQMLSRHGNKQFLVSCSFPLGTNSTIPCDYEKPSLYNINWLHFWFCRERTHNHNIASRTNETLKEEIELDLLKENSVLRLSVYDTKDTRLSKYVYDFRNNFTAIIDPLLNRCFVMQWIDENVLKASPFFSVIQKMGLCNFKIKTEHIVVPLVLKERQNVNFYLSKTIAFECLDKISYMMEPNLNKTATNETNTVYLAFAGKSFIEYNIVNIEKIKELDEMD